MTPLRYVSNQGSHSVRTRKTIDRALARAIISSGAPPSLLRAIRYSAFPGGKRIRPVIALEASRACGGNQADALAAACAIELIHTYSLIHDDLPSMDNADIRRGKASCHKRFGEAIAILAGDALLALAFNAVAARFDRGGLRASRIGVELTRELAEASGARGMVAGQVLDLEGKGALKTKRMLIEISRRKTARLFEASAKCGALAAGASAAKIAALARYGASLGMAFQIADDIEDRDDYAAIRGIDAARRDASIFIGQAKASLGGLGRRARRLAEIADRVLKEMNDGTIT